MNENSLEMRTSKTCTLKFFALALLLMMSLLGVFPLDVILPSFPAISAHFSTPLPNIALSVSLFAIGVSLSQLILGPISDAIGRKGLLLTGLIVSILGAIGCIYASTFSFFVLSRFLQAIGCGCFVLTHALVQDMFNDQERTQVRILLTTASGIFISTSPLAGAYLQQVLNWQGSFYIFIAIAAIIFAMAYLFLNSPLPKKTNSKCNPLNSYKTIATNKYFLAYSLLSAIAFSCHFSFIVISPILLIKHLGLSQYEFSLALLIYGAAYVVGGICAGLLHRHIKSTAQIIIGLSLINVAGVVVLALNTLLHLSLITILLPMIICTVGTTIVRPAATSGAMDIFPHNAGAAASLSNTILFIFGGIISAVVTIASDNLDQNLGVGLTILGLAGLLLTFRILSGNSDIPRS
ncbi:Bcr/CflA family efflux MFS transporter [Pseudomonas sp. LS1212]|uniref:Bcr/CflA family efflux MFS transporter n=1 Tax=Pseudomonas sp. LS1212 TaxID=2972478 RepID=UPI00215CA13D|nr:Bcr/CflA family efflux MFS transporter [Pseudomonas sp. LS1212]UVJ43810.1 Bcr/CflA family efflux MFS transporter [Pseudomonas sp. LS1212]